MIPRPRAEGGASDDRSAAASDGMTCSPIPMPCRSLAFARSLLLSDPQAGVVIAMCAVFVSSSSLTHSVRLVFSRRCCCSIRVRPVMRIGWRWVGAMRGCRDACGMAWCGDGLDVAMGDLMMRCVWRSVRCGTMIAPFLSARFGRSRVAIDQRGVIGELSAFSTVS